MTLPFLTNDSDGPSYFSDKELSENDYAGMMITPRVDSLNLRFRRSEPGYTAQWHVAGDPTLIIIRQGTLRIGLRDGSSRDFHSGDQFVAQDILSDHCLLNDAHGHNAKVIGDEVLLAVHVKLAQRLR